MSDKIVRGVKFGGDISPGDRRAIALHEHIVSMGRPLTTEELKAKMEELKRAIPYDDSEPR